MHASRRVLMPSQAGMIFLRYCNGYSSVTHYKSSCLETVLTGNMASGPGESSARKRKGAPGSTAETSRSRKRQRAQDVRNIPVQSAQAVPSAAGEINVAKFVQSREFEITALENGMKKSRQGLMTRAFQQVPRQMRRRTASHNVKKVPKRLQPRAKKEVCPHPDHCIVC